MLSIKIGNGIAREINSDTTIKVNKGDIIDIKPVDNATFTLTIPEVGDDVILNVTNSDGTQFDLVLQGIEPLFAAGDIITQLMLNINNEEYIVTNTTELLEALDAAAAGGETISQNRSFVDDNANLDPNRSAAEDSDVPHPIDSVELYETNVDGQIIEQYNGVMALTATNTLTEDGGVIIYTVTVNNPPLTDMLVNLNNGLSIEILAGQTVGTASLIINEENYEDVYIDSDNITASIDTVIGGGYDSLDFTTNGTALTTIVDTIDAVSVSLSSSGDTSEDGGSITYTATLTGAVANN
ncbi:MAG: hypothetical protein IE887_10990, partial [Campylobacterales bacterium]|nr:hypothetical protein [Campylobacterales bacterium]